MDDQENFKPTIVELIGRMEAGRARLETFLESLGAAEMTTPSTPINWSIKDHLAHMAAWAKGIATLLRQERRWESMGLDETFVENHDVDEINAVIYDHHKDLSLGEAKAFFQEAHQQVLDALKPLTDADLLKPYAHYQPHLPPADQADTRPIVGWIVGNTFEHYDEHLVWMKDLISQLRTPKSRLL